MDSDLDPCQVQTNVAALAEKLAASPAAASEAMQALAEDVSGQVAEACSREDWYNKVKIFYIGSTLNQANRQLKRKAEGMESTWLCL